MKRAWIVAILFLASTLFAQERRELTMDGAIEQAIENNLDIKISRISYRKSKQDILSAYGMYDLQMTLNAEHNDQTQAPRTALDASSQKTDSVYFSLSQLISTGATLTFTTNNYKYKTSDYQFSLLNPVYGSRFTFRVDQPLFNGWGRENVEYSLNLNRKYSERSLEQLKDTVMRLITQTESAYLDLVYSFRNLDVARESLELARDQFQITRKKVEVGTLAPVDQLQAEANLADARQQLVSAENLLMAAQDQIKQILNLKRNEWNVEFLPQEQPAIKLQQFKKDECIEKAMQNNPAITMARLDLNISQLTLDYTRNQKKPTVNLYGTLTYDGNNTRTLTDETGQIIIIPGSFGDAFEMATSLDNQSWSIGVNVRYPLQNRAAKAAYMKAKLDKTSNELSLENTVISVTNDIRDALRNLNSSQRSIEAARKTRELREKNLEIEKKKFVNGMSTNFLVSQREQELAKARISELNAQITYRKSLVALKQAMGILLEDRNIKLENGDI